MNIPITVADKHPQTEAAIFIEARRTSASRNSAIVSKLNDEKVVKPPRIPIVRNTRSEGSERNRSSMSVINKPIVKHPVILTKRLPYGKSIGRIR